MSVVVTYKKKGFDYPYTGYSMKIRIYGRYLEPIHKIVITNRHNTVVDDIGFFNPFETYIKIREITEKKFGVEFYSSLLAGKILSIDVPKMLFWIERGVLPPIFLSYILSDLGLVKTQMYYDYSNFKYGYNLGFNVFSFRKKIREDFLFIISDLFFSSSSKILSDSFNAVDILTNIFLLNYKVDIFIFKILNFKNKT